MQKPLVDKGWEELENLLPLQKTKVRSKKEVIQEAQNEGRTVHFASLMDICHLTNSEFGPKFQKYKGRVVLRGDIAKKRFWLLRSIYGARFVVARLPGCAGQAADAVSASLHPSQNGECFQFMPQAMKNSCSESSSFGVEPDESQK